MPHISVALKNQKTGHYERVEVEISKQLLGEYTEEFCEAFVQETYFYRIGQMSKEVIFESITYGDVDRFIGKLAGTKTFKQHIFENNPQLAGAYEVAFDNYELYDTLLKDCEEHIKQAILKKERIIPQSDSKTLTTKTYQHEGEEVVFLSFYQACYNDKDIYAVPVDVAIELSLEDYDGEEVSRWSDMWEKLSPYEVQGDLILKASCIETYNYD